MSKIFIGRRAKSVLDSFTAISDEIRVREDYLYATSSVISGIYELPVGEIETEEFTVTPLGQFLSMIDMCGESHDLDLDGSVITIADDKKSFRFITSPLSQAKERNRIGQTLFDESEEIVINFVIDESTVKDLRKAMSATNLSTIKLIGENGEVFLNAENESTQNSIKMKITGSSTEDIELAFAEGVNVFNSLYEGIYSCQIRRIDNQGATAYVIKLTNTSIGDVSENGELFYFSTLSEV